MQPEPADTPAPDATPLLPGDAALDPQEWRALGRRFLDQAIDYLPSMLAAIVILIAALVAARLVSRLARVFLERAGADPAITQLGTRLLRIVVTIFGAITAASQAGLAVGSLLAGVGVVGLAVGLAAQDTLANLVAGLTLLWDRPFRIGDTVTIAGSYGRVIEIGLRATRIRTVDARDALIPNKQVIENPIINHTLNPDLRLDIEIGIAYHEDSRNARKVLLDAIAGHPRVKEEPPPTVVMTSLADSAVELELRVWLIDPAMERIAGCELLEVAKIALDEAGIQIPFPQRTLHLGPAAAQVLAGARAPGEA